MAKMIQIRHVPETVHRRLEVKAAGVGMNLSDYLRRELEFVADRVTDEEFRARLAALPPVDLGDTSIAELLREERDARG